MIIKSSSYIIPSITHLQRVRMTSSQEFREFGMAMINYVADYLDNIRSRPVLPKVTPGYLAQLVPATAPEKPEDWRDVMKDLERVIMPGVTHWHHPQVLRYQATIPTITK